MIPATPHERMLALWIPELDDDELTPADTEDASALDPESAAEHRAHRWVELCDAVEDLVPHVEFPRPGWCVIRARGPARYYGNEQAAILALRTCAESLDFPSPRCGAASGRFAAEQAAREADGRTARIIPSERTAEFLRPLPITRAVDEELATTLISLGIRTLGALAALPEATVADRFGSAGIDAWHLARGDAPARTAAVSPRVADHDLAVQFGCEPPLDSADQLAFICREHSERLLRSLISHGLVCTELQVELTDDLGMRHERTWGHPGNFTAPDVVNRVRWQAASVPRDPDRGGSGIAAVRLTPVRTARAADHEPGLWSSAPDERVHHHLSRVQGLLGHRGVGTGTLTGGRLIGDRQRLVPWGSDPHAHERASTARTAAGTPRPRAGPWPGHIPGPAPTAVFSPPLPAALLDAQGANIVMREDPRDDDPLGEARPTRLSVNGQLCRSSIASWSAVWPLQERWWHQPLWRHRSRAAPASGPTPADTGSTVRPAPVRTHYRVQLALADGDAWLLRYDVEHGWVAEARYT